MTRRYPLALATVALLLSTGIARAQGASVAVGAAAPLGDFSSSAGTGIDVALLVRTQPMIGPIPLRVEIGYDHFPGKGGATSSTTLSMEAVSLTGDFNPMFYWAAGPGYYQSTIKGEFDGHAVTDQLQYFGTQAALGMNIPVFRWEGFLEVSAVKLFTPGTSFVYVPLRFGMHL